MKKNQQLPHLFDIAVIFGTGLDEIDPQLVSQLPRLLRSNAPVLPIAFVANCRFTQTKVDNFSISVHRHMSHWC